MKTYLLLVTTFVLLHTSAIASPPSCQIQSHIKSFGFENSQLDKIPDGWKTKAGPTGFTASVTEGVFKTGNCCLLLESRDESASVTPRPTGTLNYRLNQTETREKRIRFKASIKAEFRDEHGQAVMWLREDLKSGETGVFENMMDRPIKTSDWTEHEIVVDISPNVKSVYLGFLTFGNGDVFVDDVVIEEVSKDVEVTSKPNTRSGGVSSSPGLFEIVGSMEVRANMPLLKRLQKNEATLLVPLPLRNRSQYPVTFNLSTRPASALKSFRTFRDKLDNHVAEVVLQDFEKFEKVAVNYEAAVLVLPTNFSDVPNSVKIPDSTVDEAKPWLESTWCVNSGDPRIAKIAKDIRGETDDILEIISQVERRARAIFNRAKGNVENLTAVEALDKRGSCTSCGNLVAALLRASGVPARVLAGYPSWSGPLQTHYIVEAYIPDYGWYPIESTFCRSPWPNQNQVNVSIVPPEYESEELAGYRTGVAGGVPYLSLTEIRNNEGLFQTIGTIPDHDYCDHACKLLKEYAADENEWNQTAKWTQDHWNLWLGSKHLIEDGEVRFGPRASMLNAESPSALVTEIAESLK